VLLPGLSTELVAVLSCRVGARSRQQRSGGRHPQEGGRIYFDSGREVSYEGARIIFSDPTNIPDVVQLCIPDKKRTVSARVQWRRGNEIGLAFSGR
jgi:hypothetical protein